MLSFVRLVLSLLLTAVLFSGIAYADNGVNIPVLCYHNLNPTKRGSMNMTPEKFEAQMKLLKDNGFNIIPLKEAVAYLQGKRDSLPSKPIVVTVDDGWKSVYTYMAPILKKYDIPATLFIYPQSISSSKNYMSWEDLQELQQTGLFDIQSHTYDHPNFKQLKKRMSAEKFAQYVQMQMMKSKKILEEKTGKSVTILAWPFGIYNEYLEQQAEKSGYEMAFTIDYKAANRSFRPEAQPRYMIIDALSAQTFEGIVNQAGTKSKQG